MVFLNDNNKPRLKQARVVSPSAFASALAGQPGIEDVQNGSAGAAREWVEGDATHQPSAE